MATIHHLIMQASIDKAARKVAVHIAHMYIQQDANDGYPNDSEEIKIYIDCIADSIRSIFAFAESQEQEQEQEQTNDVLIENLIMTMFLLAIELLPGPHGTSGDRRVDMLLDRMIDVHREWLRVAGIQPRFERYVWSRLLGQVRVHTHVTEQQSQQVQENKDISSSSHRNRLDIQPTNQPKQEQEKKRKQEQEQKQIVSPCSTIPMPRTVATPSWCSCSFSCCSPI